MVAITDDDNSRDACVIPILEVGVDDVGFFLGIDVFVVVQQWR